jgi:hypothetical protein
MRKDALASMARRFGADALSMSIRAYGLLGRGGGATVTAQTEGRVSSANLGSSENLKNQD